MIIKGEEVLLATGSVMAAEFLEHRPDHAFVAKSSADPDTCECGRPITDEIYQPLLPLEIPCE